MKVLLIWPPGFEIEECIPIPLAYLLSNVDRSKNDFKVIDCSLEQLSPQSPALRKLLIDYDADVIGISSFSTTFIEALLVTRLAKSIKPSVTTIIGGPHAASYPTETIKFTEFDFVYRGEAERSFQQFLDELEKDTPDFSSIEGLTFRDEAGRVVDNGIAYVDELDSIKYPDLDTINIDAYIRKGYQLHGDRGRTAIIQATRGCPYLCSFCAAPLLNGRKLRKHSIPYLIDFVKYLYNKKQIRYINIVDDNFTFDVDFASHFCEEVVKLGFRDLSFVTSNGIRMERGNPDLWKLMKAAGWKSITVAPESGSPKTLKRMNKRIKLDTVPGIIKDMRDAGLKVYGFFIIGYPGETLEDIKQTSDFIGQCNLDFASIFTFQPLPGTPIYDELVAAGEIPNTLLPEHYSSGRMVYRPAGMENFNFSKFVFYHHLKWAVRNPTKAAAYMIRYDPRLMLKYISGLSMAATRNTFSPKLVTQQD